MATKILDAHALMVFFEDEPGADFVRGLLQKAVENDTKLLMSIVNLGEVWYAIARTTSDKIADQYVNEIKGMGVEVVALDWTLTRQAAAFKVDGEISYAKCFAAALAKIKKAELITGDRGFKVIEDLVKIQWI